ncbi:putative glycoside hydrolase [Oscillospiraceae bacterium MB08-C2-2]|nr:putative glycoside hydrolase [Oscillospiraceae bacterium MB08-C2-2]
MAKEFKIKRNRLRIGRDTYKARPHPFAVVLTVVGLVALFFVGMSVYKPFYNWIMSTPSIIWEPRESEPASQPQPAESSVPEPSEPSQPQAPAAVSLGTLRAVYLPHGIAAEPQQLEAFLDKLGNTSINAVMVELKDEQGKVLFDSALPQVSQLNSKNETTLDLAALSAQLKEKNLTLIGKMTAFQDPLACLVDRQYAITYRDTAWLWLDAAKEDGGKPWMNPYSSAARDYLSGLALEAAESGVSHIIFEAVQFPAYSTGVNANFGTDTGNLTRAQVLRAFVDELEGSLKTKGSGLSVAFGAGVFEGGDTLSLYGGSPAAVVGRSAVIGLLPGQMSMALINTLTSSGKPLAQAGLAYAQQQLEAAQRPAGEVELLPMVEAAPTGAEGYILYNEQGSYTLALG